jgi:hypothetical protein
MHRRVSWVGGTAGGAGGYPFVADSTSPISFQVKGSDGRAVTRFAIVQEKPLHLILVHRDLSGSRHLHPTMSAGGEWSTVSTVDGYSVAYRGSVVPGVVEPLLFNVTRSGSPVTSQPSTGTYRLNFQVDGHLHTAKFTLVV